MLHRVVDWRRKGVIAAVALDRRVILLEAFHFPRVLREMRVSDLNRLDLRALSTDTLASVEFKLVISFRLLYLDFFHFFGDIARPMFGKRDALVGSLALLPPVD